MITLQELFLLTGLFIISATYSYMRFGIRDEEEEDHGARLPLLLILCGACLVVAAVLDLFLPGTWPYPVIVMFGLVFGFFAGNIRELFEDLLGDLF
ncbi:MAG: hypothetical protein DRO39_04260 [Thermoprotei archaeon]|nr:MAG: hypothetical protein DRO39_04260 [Thermoprotei archaeon]